MKTPEERAAFIGKHTDILPVPLVPEISLRLAHEVMPLWQKTEEELEEMGLPPPFWAFAWAGGQALARYVLDNPDMVLDQRVLDLASGSGLVAIAAAKAGAAEVLAAEIDSFSVEAIKLNAALNDASLNITDVDLLTQPVPDTDIILVGDLFYEKPLADKLLQWLLSATEKGVEVYIGDPGRSYLPRDYLVLCETYEVPVTRDLEDAEIKKTSVWRLEN